jgi:hypothetical protein
MRTEILNKKVIIASKKRTTLTILDDSDLIQTPLSLMKGIDIVLSRMGLELEDRLDSSSMIPWVIMTH